MERKKVMSSNINSIGFDKESQILEIEFTQGNIYQYTGVSEQVFMNLIDASSHGKYFHAFVKDKYPTKRVR